MCSNARTFLLSIYIKQHYIHVHEMAHYYSRGKLKKRKAQKLKNEAVKRLKKKGPKV